jgi:hypothetical protein
LAPVDEVAASALKFSVYSVVPLMAMGAAETVAAAAVRASTLAMVAFNTWILRLR